MVRVEDSVYKATLKSLETLIITDRVADMSERLHAAASTLTWQ